MAPIRSLLSSVLVALALASQTIAAPPPAPSFSHSTHRTRSVGARALQIETYHPPSSFEVFGDGLSSIESLSAENTLESKARSFIADRLKVDSSSVEYRSGYEAGDLKHAYVRQRHNGIPFANAVANVAFKGDKPVAFGSSFVNPKNIAPSKPGLDVNALISRVEENLAGKYNGRPISLEYLARPDGSAALTHVVQIQNEGDNTWYEAFIDAHSGDLLSITDFTADAAYRVLPIQKQDITEGLELLTNPHDPAASPKGWHSSLLFTTKKTEGNNVIAYKGPAPLSPFAASQSSSGQVFDYKYDTSLEPSAKINANAARTNAFYIINRVHDIAYRYGFTEAAFNFQQDNFGKGGLGNDRVQISVQDGSGTNNANFATPPDGAPGICRMYIWDLTTPNRDGSLSNDIIVHEMTHGITNRMTGGGTARCLQTTESGGLGEGWSDAMAEWTEQKSAVIKDFVLAPYVTNKPGGIRQYPYSTSETTNPLKYSNVKNNNLVHSIGTIWANMLHQVYAALVTKHGWSPNALSDPSGTEGNIVYGHLFFDSLALQPCNPTFVNARDAWIQADADRYGGANKCLLWKAFASRGLGVNAANYVDDFSVPSGCA